MNHPLFFLLARNISKVVLNQQKMYVLIVIENKNSQQHEM
jgi:hypothetical protein